MAHHYCWSLRGSSLSATLPISPQSPGILLVGAMGLAAGLALVTTRLGVAERIAMHPSRTSREPKQPYPVERLTVNACNDSLTIDTSEGYVNTVEFPVVPDHGQPKGCQGSDGVGLAIRLNWMLWNGCAYAVVRARFVSGTARYRTWREVERRGLYGASPSLQREFELVIMVRFIVAARLCAFACLA